jgi:beta-lactamase regulating signal transducer with metallopeptidase domain
MLSHLLDVSLRVLPLALAAAAVLRIPRLRSAAWAHAAWTMVLLSMLLLFVLGPVLKPIPLRVLPLNPSARQDVTPQLRLDSDRPLLPSASAPSGRLVAPTPPRRSLSASEIVLGVYLAIAAALLGRLFVGAWLARRLLAGSLPASEGFYQSPKIAVPLTIGWFRPVILLPEKWRTWDNSKLEAVLLHERAHVRRRDSLISLLAGLNRCLFWFHPLAWWIERKLAFLAEQVCDEACVCALPNRHEYARLLLEMAGAVETSGGRVTGHALAMARPSQVHRRIDAILDETRLTHRGVTGIGWAAVALCGIPMLYAAGSLRIEPKLPLPRPTVPAFVPEPSLIAQAPLQAPRPQPLPPSKAAAVPSTVFIPVSVFETRGRIVTGLTAENFQLAENLVEQPITSFGTTDGQHAVAVLNTAGTTMAQDAFQQYLHPQDESFVTAGPPASNAEAFLTTLTATIFEVKKRQNPVKAVIVIAGGGRDNPPAPAPAVRDLIELAISPPRVEIYLADLSDLADYTSPSPYGFQQDDFRWLTQVTGGQIVPAASDLTAALNRIAVQLRNQYLLGFIPNAPAGALGSVNIEVVGARGLPLLRSIGPLGFRP